MLVLYKPVFSQDTSRQELVAHLGKIVSKLDGKVGIGVMGLDFKDTLFVNDNARFPMQSVYKFPLAIFVLHKVDIGALTLEDTVHIRKSTLEKNTWSPLLTDNEKEEFDFTVKELLRYSVSKSDNNACDLLFRLAGGTAAVDAYFKQHGVRDMMISTTEAEMHKSWDVQYTNWCKPSAMLQVLSLLYKDSLLKPASKAYLMKIMTESENPHRRIKGLLPEGTIVAHKTGTSDTNAEGVKAATNDVAVITLPDGRHYALVVYVSDYRGGIDIGEKVIAEISKAIWDYYSLPRK